MLVGPPFLPSVPKKSLWSIFSACANVWLYLTYLCSTVLVCQSTNVAVLLIGEARVNDEKHLKDLQQLYEGVDCFVCMSARSAPFLHYMQITSYSFEDLNLLPVVLHSDPNWSRRIQWLRYTTCFEQLQKHANRTGKIYSVIVKSRTDLRFEIRSFKRQLKGAVLSQQVLHADSDRFFFGTPETMLVFASLHRYMQSYANQQGRYQKLNYDVILESDLWAASFEWLEYPSAIVSRNVLKSLRRDRKAKSYQELRSTNGSKRFRAKSLRSQPGWLLKHTIETKLSSLRNFKHGSTMSLAAFAHKQFSSEQALVLHANKHGVVIKGLPFGGQLYTNRSSFVYMFDA